jgi:hypothetical protein
MCETETMTRRLIPNPNPNPNPNPTPTPTPTPTSTSTSALKLTCAFCAMQLKPTEMGICMTCKKEHKHFRAWRRQRFSLSRTLFHHAEDFDTIAGYEDIKNIIGRALHSEESFNLLLWGEPASCSY